MGRQHSKRRSMVIRQKQKRRAKLAQLRKLYKEGKKDKGKILEKVFKIAPMLSKEEFLKPTKEEKVSEDNKPSDSEGKDSDKK